MSNKFIIIPAYNEARRISHVISDIREAYGNQYKIVVVNDGSSDNTASIAEISGIVIGPGGIPACL